MYIFTTQERRKLFLFLRPLSQTNQESHYRKMMLVTALAMRDNVRDDGGSIGGGKKNLIREKREKRKTGNERKVTATTGRRGEVRESKGTTREKKPTIYKYLLNIQEAAGILKLRHHRRREVGGGARAVAWG